MSTVTWLSRLALIAALGACTPTAESDLTTQLPRPDHIYVGYFAVTPEQVRLKQGVSARIIGLTKDHPFDAKASQAARSAQAALAEALVGRLKKLGLPGEIATNNIGSGSGLLVQGQIVAPDPGDRTRRVLIGLKAGNSSISADTQLFSLTETASPNFVTAFEAKAHSDRAHGAAEAVRLADAVAQQIGHFAVAQGWILQTALK